MAVGRSDFSRSSMARVSVGIAAAWVVSFSSGCRSQLDARGPGRVNMRSHAVDVSAGLDGQRSYFQSRSAITLSMTDEQISDGDTLSLTNVTTGATLIDGETIDRKKAGLTGDGYSLSSGSTAVEIRVFPEAAEMLGKLDYGKNLLRLDVESSAGERSFEKEIVLEDFTMFGLSRARFSEDIQVKEGFQGWFPGIVRPAVTAANGSTLRVDFFHIINN